MTGAQYTLRLRQRLPALLPLLALLLLPLALTQSVSQNCTNLSAPLYERERCVRESILRPGATSAPFYDKHVSPTVEYMQPVNVSMLLQVWQINELSVQDSQMELAAWTTFEWIDERLAFNETESGVVATTAFASLDPEHSEIWVPPVYLLNRKSAESGLQASATKDAVIFPNGKVSWRNQHNLGLLCTFYGLKAIPFDKLTGHLMFGTWTRPDFVVNLTFAPRGAPGREGLVFGFDDELEPNMFREYSIKMDECETYTDTIFDKNLGISYPILMYQIVVTRSKNFYLVKIVVPNIILTYLSFGIFLLDVRCGERLGYGITLLLAMFAVDITASALLPISDAWLWINVLIGVSTCFAVMALVESILVLWLYYKYKTDEDAVSPFIDIAKPARMVFNAADNAFDNPSAPPQEEEFHDAHEVHSKEAAARRKRTARQQYLHERNLEERYVAMGMRLDFFALILFLLFYSVFVLVMFLTASSWD